MKQRFLWGLLLLLPYANLWANDWKLPIKAAFSQTLNQTCHAGTLKVVWESPTTNMDCKSIKKADLQLYYSETIDGDYQEIANLSTHDSPAIFKIENNGYYKILGYTQTQLVCEKTVENVTNTSMPFVLQAQNVLQTPVEVKGILAKPAIRLRPNAINERTECANNTKFSVCDDIYWQNASQNIDYLILTLLEKDNNGNFNTIAARTVKNEPRLAIKTIFPMLNQAGEYKIKAKTESKNDCSEPVEEFSHVVSIYYPQEIPNPIFLPNSCNGNIDFTRLSFALPIININTKQIKTEIVKVLDQTNIQFFTPPNNTTTSRIKLEAFDSIGNYTATVLESKAFKMCGEQPNYLDIQPYIEQYERRQKTNGSQKPIYKVSVKMENECGAAKAEELFFVVQKSAQKTPAIKAQNLPIAIKYYPNPFDNTITIDMGNAEMGEQTYTAYLYNMMGQQVSTITINSKIVNMNTALLPAGIYIFYIKNNKGELIQTNKLIKS
jgi:Secretion system C-terminal sorting domain